MWPLFNAETGRHWAACVPLAMTLKFFLIGMGLLQDEDAVKSMSRSGDRRELLRGPTLYGFVFVLCTALVWKDFRSVIALCALCFGDGAAEIWGRRFGRGNALPWSSAKSYAGTVGFAVTSAVSTLLFAALLLIRGGHKRGTEHSVASLIGSCVPRVVVVNILAALCESLPMGDYDNLAVFVAAAGADAAYCEVFKGHSRIIENAIKACL
jgi:dolichol kinase